MAAAVPGLEAATAAQAAFCSILDTNFSWTTPQELCVAAVEAYCACAAVVVAFPHAADAGRLVERCAAGVDGVAVAHFRAKARGSHDAEGLSAFLTVADTSYAALCSALARKAPGCALRGAGRLTSSGRCYAAALRRRGDLARYAAELCNASPHSSLELYAASADVWPQCGETWNAMGAAVLLLGDELAAVHHFLQALASAEAMPAARVNALAVMRHGEQAGRLQSGDASSCSRSEAVLHSRVLAPCLHFLATPARSAEASVNDAATAFVNGIAAGTLSATGALSLFTSLLAVEASMQGCNVAGAEARRQVMTLLAQAACAVCRSAADAAAMPHTSLGQHGDTLCLFIDWLTLHWHRLDAALHGRRCLADMQDALAAVLTALQRSPGDVAGALMVGPAQLRTALPHDIATAGLAPLHCCHSLRTFEAPPGAPECPQAVQHARLMAFAAWASLSRVGLLRFDPATGAYFAAGHLSDALSVVELDAARCSVERLTLATEKATSSATNAAVAQAAPEQPDAPRDALHAATCGRAVDVLIDVLNVGRCHARGECFSTAGVAAAFDFWRSRGHRACGFIPVHYLRGGSSGPGLWPQREAQTLHAWVAQGMLYPCPSDTYDDLFMLSHAQQLDGVVVSNDRFHDVVGGQADAPASAALAAWLRTHVCRFAFAGGDTFIPNPAFALPPPLAGRAAQG